MKWFGEMKSRVNDQVRIVLFRPFIEKVAWMALNRLIPILARFGRVWFVDGKYLTIFKRQPDGSWKAYRDCFNSNNSPRP